MLGFQAHNLTSVETASPTMSKTGRNVLLAITSNLKLKCNTGDVSSAFLQTHESLEDQELTVWAPPELAVMFGARPEDPRVLRAFYGLVHAPRKWYESVISTMVSQGWKQLQGDKCLLVLLDEKKEIAGLAGIHVDDFLLSGREGSLVYKQAEEKLRQTFRFGKWESHLQQPVWNLQAAGFVSCPTTRSTWTRRTMWRSGLRRFLSIHRDRERPNSYPQKSVI